MNGLDHKLQAILVSQVGKSHTHNIVAALQSYDRRIDFAGAAGTADPHTGATMTPDTPIFVASITKMFTAALAMALHQQGRLDLEAPISRYLPPELTGGIHLYQGTDYSEHIQVYQLINQSSGLADYEVEKPPGGKSVLDELKSGRDRAISTPEAVAIVRQLKPHFPPGKPGKAYYSNLNYRLLGEIIETVSGQPLAVCFAEEICAPLGLQHTYSFAGSAPRPELTPATVYFKDRPANIPHYLASNVSDGGLVSTAPELVTFLRAFFEGRLFDQSLLERMTTWNSIFFPLRYGYGLMYFQLPRYYWFTSLPEFIGHSGSTGSFAFSCPSKKLYLAGTINQVSPARPFFLMMSLVRAVR